MRKGTKSKNDKTKPCKAISHEWKKKRRVNMTKLNHVFTLRFFSHSWLMGLHGLVLSYLFFVSFLIHDLWVCMVYDKTKPCKPMSHEWEKEWRVNMTKLNHANP
jgi:hypothetical protein